MPAAAAAAASLGLAAPGLPWLPWSSGPALGGPLRPSTHLPLRGQQGLVVALLQAAGGRCISSGDRPSHLSNLECCYRLLTTWLLPDPDRAPFCIARTSFRLFLVLRLRQPPPRGLFPIPHPQPNSTTPFRETASLVSPTKTRRHLQRIVHPRRPRSFAIETPWSPLSTARCCDSDPSHRYTASTKVHTPPAPGLAWAHVRNPSLELLPTHCRRDPQHQHQRAADGSDCRRCWRMRRGRCEERPLSSASTVLGQLCARELGVALCSCQGPSSSSRLMPIHPSERTASPTIPDLPLYSFKPKIPTSLLREPVAILQAAPIPTSACDPPILSRRTPSGAVPLQWTPRRYVTLSPSSRTQASMATPAARKAATMVMMAPTRRLPLPSSALLK